jgi:hypothetical protein
MCLPRKWRWIRKSTVFSKKLTTRVCAMLPARTRQLQLLICLD